MFSLYGFTLLHLFETGSIDQSEYLKKLAYVGLKITAFSHCWFGLSQVFWKSNESLIVSSYKHVSFIHPTTTVDATYYC